MSKEEILKLELANLVYACRLFVARAERYGTSGIRTKDEAKDVRDIAKDYLEAYEAVFGYV